MCVLRLRPEDQDVLVEFPRLERVVQRVARVSPPQGFALSQARHQARKVTMLHTMLKVSRRESGVLMKRGRSIFAVLLRFFFYICPKRLFISFSELPGLHVLPVGGFAAQLLGFGQRYTQPETAHSAATSTAHTCVPQRQQVHTLTHARDQSKDWRDL